MVFVSYFGIIQLLAEHYLQSWLCCRLSFILIWLNLQINKSNTIFLHEAVIVFGRSTLFEQRPLKSLSSACPYLRLSVKFSQDWIISSFWSCTWWAMISSDSWPWYLATDKTIFLKKKIGGPNWGQLSRFCKFEIAYNDSLQQFIICSRGKTRKKNWGD